MVSEVPYAVYVLSPVGVNALIEQAETLIGSSTGGLSILVDPTWTVALNSIV